MGLSGFDSPIKSIQRGLISLPHTSAEVTVAITAVDTSKTMLNYLARSYTGDNKYAFDTAAYFRLTNATTITVTRQGTDNVVALSYEVIEYK